MPTITRYIAVAVIGDYEWAQEEETVGTFSSREEANAAIKKHSAGMPSATACRYTVLEHELDESAQLSEMLRNAKTGTSQKGIYSPTTFKESDLKSLHARGVSYQIGATERLLCERPWHASGGNKGSGVEQLWANLRTATVNFCGVSEQVYLRD